MQLSDATKEERKQLFIEQALLIHGKKFDYSKVKWVNARSPVTLLCREHGPWLASPSSHIHRKSGCPSCAGNARYTEKSLLQRLREDGRYTKYRVVSFAGVNSIIEARCTDHGTFQQLFNNHRTGAGCPACAVNATTDADEFLRRSKAVHGSRYDYSRVKYKGTKTAVCIRCPDHGDFWQRPEVHWRGAGCHTCAYKYKKVRIKGRDFWLQGYEHHGIRWIIENTSVKLAEIQESRNPDYRKRPPHIRYVCPTTGKTRTYFPDLWIPARNIVVEVKSLYTLGAPGTPERKVNEVKKQAVLAAGHKYRLLVFDAHGQRVTSVRA